MKRFLAILVTLALSLTLVSLPALAEEGEKVSIETYVINPWVTSELPSPETDIYKNYIDDKFGVDFKLTYSAEGETELLTRFASGNAPDLIKFSDFAQLNKFYEQDVLLDDWTPYLDMIQPFVAQMGEEQLKYFTKDDQLMAVATQPGEQTFAWMIRQDWLDTLGLAMPTSLDELSNVLYAFTYNDPDQNGEDDTYGITSAGGGKSIGELINLLAFFDDTSWYVNEAGEIDHPILNGAYLEFLKYVKSLYDAGVIDPNWYTQGWEERKSELFSGSYGICWYPPDALLDENKASRKDEVADEWWNVMPMFSGKLPAKSILGASILSVSAECAKDDAKMQKIFDMMNTFITPNDEYYELRRSANIDGQYMIRNDDGTVYVWRDYEGTPYKQLSGEEGSYIGCAVYGQVFGSYGDGYFGGDSQEISAHTQKMMELVGFVNGMDHYSADKQLLTLDATVLEEVDMVFQEFTINYILGTDDNYDAFVEAWLAAGGEDLKETVREQWQAYGIIE